MTEITIQEYLKPYKKWLAEQEKEGEFAHNTIRQREYAVDEFVAYFRYHDYQIDLENFYGSTDLIKEFFDQTVVTQSKVSCIKAFLEFIGRQLDTRNADRLEDIKERITLSKLTGTTQRSRRSRHKRLEEKLLTKQELDRVYAVSWPFEALMVRTMLDTGCRPGELAALSLRDFDFDVPKEGIGATVKIDKTYSQGIGVQDHPKSDYSIRTVNLRPKTAQLLQAHLEREGIDDDELIFGDYRTVYDTLKELFTFAQVKLEGGITKFSPHGLRHNTATRLIRVEDYSKPMVQQYMGHSSVIITEIYEHFKEDEVLDIYA